MKHIAPEQKNEWEGKNHVKIEFDDHSLGKYSLLITDCSDDLFDTIKQNIDTYFKQNMKILNFEFQDLPGSDTLLDDKNLVVRNRLEEIKSKYLFHFIFLHKHTLTY